MTTHHIDVLWCDSCGVEGCEFWSEFGHMDQHERTTMIEGEFEAVSSSKPWFGLEQRDTIVCRRCGDKPRVTSSRLAGEPPPAMVKGAAIPLVHDRIPTVVASGEERINLRVHDGPRLVDVSLSRAWALRLAHDLLGALLSAQLGDDSAMGQERLEERVARRHAGGGG
jgi:hypothetical protein